MLKSYVLMVVLAASAGGADKYAADWMTYGAGARPLGMGGAYVAVADDATAGYWNPAGLVSVNRAGANAMHSYAFNGLGTYDSVFGAYNFGAAAGAVGAGMLRFGTDDIKLTSWEDPTNPNSRPRLDGTASWADYGFYGFYGRQFLPWLRVGAAGKFILGDHLDGKVEGANSSGQSFDAGAMVGPFGPMTFGVNAQDIYGHVRWDTGTNEVIPPNLKTGAAYRAVIASWQSEALLTADCNVRFAGYDYAAQLSAGEASFDFNAGGEWCYRRTLALRLGVERSAFTGGVGVSARALGLVFGIDYAYLSDDGLSSSHRASAGVAF